jgi:hypothetical protein
MAVCRHAWSRPHGRLRGSAEDSRDRDRDIRSGADLRATASRPRADDPRAVR